MSSGSDRFNSAGPSALEVNFSSSHVDHSTFGSIDNSLHCCGEEVVRDVLVDVAKDTLEGFDVANAQLRRYQEDA